MTGRSPAFLVARGHDVDVDRFVRAQRSPLANVLGVVLSPLVNITAACMAVALRTEVPLWDRLLFGGVLAAWCAWFPYVIFFWMARTGAVDDVHVLRRRQRLVPLVAALACVVVGVAVSWWWGAPRALMVLVWVMLGSLCVMALVTTVYKVSFHAGVATGAAGVVWWPGSPWWVAAALGAAVCAVGWARVRAGRHTWGQVVLGTAVGVVSTATFWWAA